MNNVYDINDFSTTLLNSIDSFVYVSDVDTCEIIFMNDKMKKEFNILEDVVGKHCFEIFEGGKTKNCKNCYIEKIVDSNFLNCSFEEYNPNTEKFYKNTDSFIKWIDNRIVHLRQSEDITEEKLLQSNLESAKQEADKANQSKKDFFDRMQNNLNIPISSIIGLSRIAGTTGDLSKIKLCLTKIDEETKSLALSISDILDMSKIETSKLSISCEPFSFENMLIGVSNSISDKCAKKNQIFQVRMDMQMPSHFLGDQLRLSQALNNILLNAVNFTPNGGKIQVEVNQLSLINNISTIEISVYDTGVGISRKEQSKLLSLFEEKGELTKYDGVGLGLPIAKSIIELMGGEIRLYSNENIGSTFSFIVNLEVFKSNFIERKLLPGMNIKNLKILLVDSSYEVCEYFRKIMNGFKVECDTTTTYLGVMEKLENAKSKNKPYNVVFLDRNEKDSETIELIKLIKSQYDNFIIMLSKSEYTDIEKEARKAGVHKIVQKPLFPSMLLDVINELVTVENTGESAYIKKHYNFESYNILLVEDVEVNREMLSKLLKDTKIKIHYAENGIVALEMFKQDYAKFDLILMDVNMPELDGYGATREIRNLLMPKATQIPIIAMTANFFEEDINACLGSGMNDHIAKPIEINKVLEKLEKYLPKKDDEKDERIDIEKYMNVEEGLARVRGNMKIYKALLSNFIKNTRFELLQKSLKNYDTENALKACHNIKGTSSNLSLMAVLEIVTILEDQLINDIDIEETSKEVDTIFKNTVRSIEIFLAC